MEKFIITTVNLNKQIVLAIVGVMVYSVLELSEFNENEVTNQNSTSWSAILIE